MSSQCGQSITGSLVVCISLLAVLLATAAVPANAQTFDVPGPWINSVSPNTAIAGGRAFTLTASGILFDRSSAVQWNNVLLSTTTVSESQLTATVSADLIARPGAAQVRVVELDEALKITYSQSTPVIFTILQPPTISSLNPPGAVASGAGFTLTVNGSGFGSGAIVQWNGVGLETRFINQGQLTASVSANLIAASGTAQVSVLWQGVNSNNVSFPVVSGPTITSLSPNTALAGGPAFTLTVNGAGFTNATIIRWSGLALATTFIDATHLSASVPANLIAEPLTAQITAFLQGVASNAVDFVVAPRPTITSLNPNTATAGGPAFTLTVNGSGFANGAVVQWSGTALGTTFINASQLTTSVPATLVAVPGMAQIIVVSQGVTSNAVPFVIGPASQTAIYSVHLRAADPTAAITTSTQEFVFEIGVTVSTVNAQPVRALVINFMPTASSQLTGATNTLSIETMVDGYFAANPTLRSFHLDLPVSIRGNLADIAGLQLSIMDKSNVRLPTCTADLRSASIVNDACRY